MDAAADFNNFVVAKFDNPTWTALTVGPPDAQSVTAFGITSFGDFQVGEVGGSGADYRTSSSGQWQDPGIWEYYNGSSWVPAPISPDASSGIITISSGHTVDINGFYVVLDQVVVQSGGAVLSVIDGAITYNTLFSESFIDVDGTFNVISSIINGDNYSAPGATLNINSGGVLAVQDSSSLEAGLIVNNNGSALFTGVNTIQFQLETVINNFGLIDIESNLTFDDVGTELNNDGTLSFTGDLQFSSVDGLLRNNSGGVINIDGQWVFNPFIENYGALNINNSNSSLEIGSDNNIYAGTIALASGSELINGNTMIFEGTGVTNNGTIDVGEFIFEGSSAQTLGGTGNWVNLSIDNNNDVNLVGSTEVQTITNTLNLNNGRIITGTNKIEMEDGAIIGGGSANSYIAGNLSQYFIGSIPMTYDIGDALSYTPLIVNPTITTPGSITARTDAGDHPDIANSDIDGTKSVNRIWSLEDDGIIQFSNYTLDFTWVPGDVDGGADPLLFSVAKYDNPVWQTLGASAQTATTLTTFYPGPAMSDFQIGEQNACLVNIPDANFKAALVANLAINTNGNLEIECTEAIAFTGDIDVHSLGISDLTGIEAFIAATSLTCYDNDLITIDISANTNLQYFSCFQNLLTSLDLSSNTQLNTLLFGFNQIPTIDLSANTALTFIACDNGALTSLDLSANTALTFLNIYNNPLTSLNIQNGNNSNISYFSAVNCPSLTCIQVSDVAYMNSNWVAGKDAGASFSSNCDAPVITCAPAFSVCQDNVNGACSVSFTPPVSIQVGPSFTDRNVTYTGVSINGAGNSAVVAPGALVSLNYNVVSNFDINTVYCPGCVYQGYIGIGGTFQTLQCEQYISSGFSNSYTSGNFVAPSSPGVYYLTYEFTLDYTCQPMRFNNNPANAIGVLVVGPPFPVVVGGTGTVTVTNDAPSCLPVGITTVTWTATDALNNTATCTQDVTVTPGTIYYRDRDGDGYGNAAYAVYNCSQPAGFILDNTDCNDDNASLTTNCIVCNAPAYTPHAATWQPVDCGTNGLVQTLYAADSNTELYAGGNFTSAGNVAANDIAKWDGSSWTTLGTGMVGDGVDAISKYQGLIYAGGRFTEAGGVSVNYIANWDNSSWNKLTGITGFDNAVKALQEYNGDLYMAGVYANYYDDPIVTTNPANKIVKWNGSNLTTVPGFGDYTYDGIYGSNAIRALVVYNGELIAAGNFNVANGDPGNNIARWNGTSWQPLGTGLDYVAFSLVVHNGDLYVGGMFTLAGGIPVNGIAKWNGSMWSAVGTKNLTATNTLKVYKNELYATGEFTNSGNPDYIAKFDGTDWIPVSDGINNWGRGLEVFDNDLYVGGNLSSNALATTPLSNIGRYFNCDLTLTTSANDTLIICTESGQTTGSVTLVPMGGTAPYTYGGDPTSNLTPGNYTYTVTDNFGCTAQADLFVQLTNCLIPYYEPPVNGIAPNIIGSELTQLYNYPDSLVDTTSGNNIFLIDYVLGQVLIEVICDSGQYAATLALLQTPAYGLNNIINNGESDFIITGMFPIANLPSLDLLTSLLNYVRPYYPPIALSSSLPTTGLTTTQGDKVMYSDKAKEAWKVTGKGIKVGVMSDSYNTKFGNPAALDIINGDLPGSSNPNYSKSVIVAEEYPFGRGTDEGRAMMQIIHDVAPDAELMFKSGFISAGNFAEGIISTS